MGGEPRRILLVGCEPAELGEEEDGRMGLSPAVATAVEEAARMIEGIIRQAAGEWEVKSEG
jgi:hydrogenase maturation protease